MPNLYSEIREDLRWVADTLEDHEFEYSAYNKGVQYNAKDRNGIIHTFYPTTGSIIFHWSNNRADSKLVKTFRDRDLDYFMNMLEQPKEIRNLFTSLY